ncbi:DUF2935 domain-containing protein [Paenibacillus filicis]|uniref:DUF2935 domain-containing protein n=1 Tax=Paenibacillus gyeongsangnamensis TaxID=3388067 RepID=A0ABT4Q581_9BACL|nr:DUF2935 domain-containing protein [Paenibacillus filicis]MCZ8512033.1 DUF2935 domain-containing protein [Paenibacillus filicis]
MTNSVSFSASATFEHTFWLQVLGDHARFIRDALHVQEREETARAMGFVERMDSLLGRARTSMSDPELIRLSQEAYERTLELRSFKLHLLRRHLTEGVGLRLPPSFLSHMVNELEEYLRVLGSLRTGQPAPAYDAVHHHVVWLQDAYGHASSIIAELDMSEKRLMELGQTFDLHFRDFFVKAVELAGYLRTHLKDFSALERFNKEVELEMVLFQQFLRELGEHRMTKETLGTLSPLMADHMAREECYYLTKLSHVSKLAAPSCDPARERKE